MLGVYELREMALAADLFAWTYRRSCARYSAVLQSVGAADPVGVMFRPQRTEAMDRIVRERVPLAAAPAGMGLDSAHERQFEPLLRRELAQLQEHHCARYRLSTTALQSWIAAGRPD